jgi:hypothetical protein
MVQTLVRLEGEEIDIEDLVEFLPKLSWNITKLSDGFYLTSEKLSNIQKNRDVIAKAQEILDILNGAANIQYQNHQKVTPSNMMRIDKEGRHHYVLITESIVIRSRTNKSPEKASNTWLELSDKDEYVRDALFFFKEITWFNLYKVFEVIRDDVGNEKVLQEKKLMSASEIHSFRGTSQNRRVIGELARHGTKNFQIPKKPITLEEAYNLMKRVFENWIKTKEL